MTLDESLKAHFTAHAGLTALVSNRVYPRDTAPQRGSNPYVTYWRVASPRIHTHQGMASLTGRLYQFDVWATTVQVARAVARQVAGALDSLSSQDIDRAFVSDDGTELPEQPETGIKHIAVEATIWSRLD